MAQLRIRLRPWPVTVLVAWTLFCWTTRVPLLWTLHQSEADKLRETIPVLVFVVMAVVALVAVIRSGEVLAGRARTAALVLAVWSIGYWVLRLPFILSDPSPDRLRRRAHDAGGRSRVGLSIWALRTIRPAARPRRPAEGVPPPPDPPARFSSRGWSGTAVPMRSVVMSAGVAGGLMSAVGLRFRRRARWPGRGRR